MKVRGKGKLLLGKAVPFSGFPDQLAKLNRELACLHAGEDAKPQTNDLPTKRNNPLGIFRDFAYTCPVIPRLPSGSKRTAPMPLSKLVFRMAFAAMFLLVPLSANAQCPVSVGTPAMYAIGGNPQFTAVGDLNRDGIPDAVVTSSDTNTLSILLGIGNGAFQPASVVPTSPNPLGVVIADFNHDGNADVAVANGGVGPNYNGSVSIFLGNGNGTFQPATNYATGINSSFLLMADLNHDGNPDLVVINPISNSVSVLIGNANGTFQAAVNFPAGTFPGGAAIGDFNGDGNADLAIANYVANGAVVVLLGRGDGTFQPAVSYPTGSVNTGSVATADFNGDGVLDLITTNREGGNCSLLLGNGNGTFQTATQLSAGSDPVRVIVGDFNGDGLPDLAVANFIPNYFVIRLGNGNGTFQSATTFPTGNPPLVTAADLNGDGKPDLIVPNGQFRNTVSVFLNTSTGGPPITLSQQPVSVKRCPTGSATFSVTTTSGTPAYRWQVETSSGVFMDLADGTNQPAGGVLNASGSGTPTVQVQIVQETVPTRNYRCRVSNACSTTVSNVATLSICKADFNCNGTVEIQDIFAYLSAWFAGDSHADVNGLPGLSIGDIFFFLELWFTGCP